MSRHIRAKRNYIMVLVGMRDAIHERIGWHTFRTLRKERRRCETVQERLRHANSRITLDVYTQAGELAHKRAAQSGL